MKFRSRSLVISTIALAYAALAFAQVQKRDFPGVVNFAVVDANTGTGGSVAPEALPRLKAEGYAVDIDLRTPEEPGSNVAAERDAAGQIGLRYVNIPVNGAKPDAAAADKFLQTMRSLQGQRVFIHCGSGNRVGALWLIKRVVQDSWPLDQATAEAEAIGLHSPALKAFATEYVGKVR